MGLEFICGGCYGWLTNKYSIINLFLVKGGHTGKDLAFKEFQGGTTAGRDVTHLVGQTSLLYGSDGVTTTNDGDAALGK